MARGEALRRMGQPQQALAFLGDWRAYAAEVGKEGELMLRVYDLMALSGRVPETKVPRPGTASTTFSATRRRMACATVTGEA